MVLDTTVTPELEAEGWAADVIRGLQDARKNEGFEVSDRIRLRLSVPAEKKDWADQHIGHIAEEVLAVEHEVLTSEKLAHEIVDGVTAEVAKVAR